MTPPGSPDPYSTDEGPFSTSTRSRFVSRNWLVLKPLLLTSPSKLPYGLPLTPLTRTSRCVKPRTTVELYGLSLTPLMNLYKSFVSSAPMSSISRAGSTTIAWGTSINAAEVRAAPALVST